MAKRSWGSGSVFQRGSTWWIAYRVNGKLHRESAETDIKQKAQNKLKDRLMGIHGGTFDPNCRNTTIADLYAILHNDYFINQKSSIEEVARNWKNHLGPFFGHAKASQISYQMVGRYIEERQKKGAANGTCNRELSNLKRAFHLGLRSGVVSRMPVFPSKLAENNVRTGFVEPEQYSKLANATAKTGLWFRAIFEVGYTWGWRKEEVLGLRVQQVDLKARTVRLNVGETKNKEGRLAVMTKPLYELLKLCVEGKKPTDHVFTRECGKRVLDFRGAWEIACTESGCPNLLFHDLRRTAVRNMVRAGIPESIAMKISGHKTRSVFERYNIVSEKDIAEAATKIEAFHKCSQNVHNEVFSADEPKMEKASKTLTVQ
jgi:integrase